MPRRRSTTAPAIGERRPAGTTRPPSATAPTPGRACWARRRRPRRCGRSGPRPRPGRGRGGPARRSMPMCGARSRPPTRRRGACAPSSRRSTTRAPAPRRCARSSRRRRRGRARGHQRPGRRSGWRCRSSTAPERDGADGRAAEQRERVRCGRSGRAGPPGSTRSGRKSSASPRHSAASAVGAAERDRGAPRRPAPEPVRRPGASSAIDERVEALRVEVALVSPRRRVDGRECRGDEAGPVARDLAAEAARSRRRRGSRPPPG